MLNALSCKSLVCVDVKRTLGGVVIGWPQGGGLVGHPQGTKTHVHGSWCDELFIE
jgi:hypothetical protein